jgi:putative phage-type endonuclease
MAIKYHTEIQQNTDEWLNLRLGIITGSNINIIVTPTGKAAKNDAMRKYAAELAAQRITKRAEENFQSWDMMRGHIQEDIARDIYRDNYAQVEECGFITNDNLGFVVGCSPDGLVGEDGGIEIKSRKAKFQIETIAAGEMPKEYANQVQAFLLVSGRTWCDFVQYSSGMAFYVERVTVDPVRREAIIDAIMAFEDEIERVRNEYLAKASDMIQTEWVDINFDAEIEGAE